MNEDTHTGAMDLTGLFVAVGRIEQKLTDMANREEKNEGRLERVETGLNEVRNTVAIIQSAQKPRAPWYVIAGGMAGIGSLVLSAFMLITILNKIAEVLQ
jgi:hypothetical protein